MNKGRNKVILTTIFVVAIVFLTLVTGCSLLDGKSRDILTIAPVDLYAGDQEKFKPFMGHSASIKLDYNGKKKNLAFVYQIWENGIPIPNSKGGLSDHLFRLDEDGGKHSEELIVSIRPVSYDKELSSYELTIVSVTENGYSASTHSIQVNGTYNGFAFQGLPEKISLEDEGEVIVMGLEATTLNRLTTKSLEQAQQEAEWFFGLSVILTDEEIIFP